MPMERRGFFFDHFEKITCAVVAAGLLLSIFYLTRRTSGENITKITGEMVSLQGVLATLERTPPPPQAFNKHVDHWREGSLVVMPEQVRDVFHYPRPIYYAEKLMGTDKGYVLQFDEPLAVGSVVADRELPTVAGNKVVDRIEHPVGVDYSKVKVYTRGEGSARIIGMVGKRRHIYPIRTDWRLTARVEPPLEFSVKVQQEGVQLSFKANPRNKEELPCAVIYYEVWRRKATDVNADFVLIRRLPVSADELTPAKLEIVKRLGVQLQGVEGAMPGGGGMPGGTVPGGMGPGGGGMPGAGGGMPGAGGGMPGAGGGMPGAGGGMAGGAGVPAKEAKAGAKKDFYSWTDDSRLDPEEVYGYRVRAVAALSIPRESVYTREQKVRTLPTVDFQFKGQFAKKLRFDIVVYDGNAIRKATFENSLGEEIGGLQEGAGGMGVSFLTHCEIVDYFDEAVRQRPFQKGRMAYADGHGNVKLVWKGETASGTTTLFDMAAKAAAATQPTTPTGAGPGVPGPGGGQGPGPGPVGPGGNPFKGFDMPQPDTGRVPPRNR